MLLGNSKLKERPDFTELLELIADENLLDEKLIYFKAV